MWTFLLVVYVGVVCFLCYWAWKLLEPSDKKGKKTVAWFIAFWPVIILWMVYIMIKANVKGGYEKGWFEK